MKHFDLTREILENKIYQIANELIRQALDAFQGGYTKKQNGERKTELPINSADYGTFVSACKGIEVLLSGKGYGQTDIQNAIKKWSKVNHYDIWTFGGENIIPDYMEFLNNEITETEE